MAAASDRAKALQAAMAKITKDFGEGAIMRMDADSVREVEIVPTGSLPLDIALGVGGLPKGRIVEIFGPEASGKTTFCYHVMAETQKAGGICGFIDAEHAMDPVYAAKVGVNVGDLLVSQPDNGEQALDIAETLIRSGACDLIVIDSVAALTPKAELEGEMGDAAVGLHARLMAKACRKLASLANQNGTIVVFTNQIRMKIGVMFGSPETTTGGRALPYAASVRLDIRRIETLKDGTEAYGNRVRVKVVKNKVAPPFKQAEFDIIYGDGFDRMGALIDLALDPRVGLITKSGAFFTFPSGDKAQGKVKAANYLRENPEVALELDTKVRETLMPKKVEAPSEDASGSDGYSDALEAEALVTA